ncbi:DUF917 domain-containing protein (plasmid) [Streptomycetaceae bacterium NBC_01309]
MDDLAAGATLLGSGGGGDARAGAMLARQQLNVHGPVELLPLESLPPDAMVACVGAVGSTTALVERLPGGSEFVAAARALEHHLGASLAAVQPLEIGGVNGLLAVVAAAGLGLPLVDADAMGRAFPRLDQTTLAAHGVAASPTALAEARGQVLVVVTPERSTLEPLIRQLLPAMGGWCAIATHPAPARSYAPAVVHNSVSRAMRIGAEFLAAQRACDGTARAAFLRRQHAIPLRGGVVTEVRRQDTSSGLRATVTIMDRDEAGRTIRLEAGDEYVLVLDDGEPVAATPEIICAVDSRTWTCVGPESIMEYQQVDVFALPAAAAWTADTSTIVGLTAYGLHETPGGEHGLADIP